MIRIAVLLFFLFIEAQVVQAQFVRVCDPGFCIDQNTYRYLGCNYWYGAYLALDTPNNGQRRLQHELDFLKKQGVNNLRVMFSGEGDSTYAYRIAPAVQTNPGQFNEEILKSFDYFLNECRKRNLKVIAVLNNNWEWSGGMGQYLEWNEKGPAPLPKTEKWDWDAYCNYIAQFYSCMNCQTQYENFVRTLLERNNSINKLKYKNDPTIMAWQLANEPRPMRKDAKDIYLKWITRSSSFIKSIDSLHLVSVGVEGYIGTALDTALYVQIHRLPSVDYATIHIWPKTWQWYNGESEQSTADTSLQKTKRYIEQHTQLCAQFQKPLVIEEFGLHRDENLFSPQAGVKNRNTYYQTIFEACLQHSAIAGCNFWGYAGLSQNVNDKLFMQKGMSYAADPPQEEQGLYAVFESDKSTWKLIRQYAGKIKTKNTN